MHPTRPRINYTDRDYASLREAMLELARKRLEWNDQSPNDLGVMLIELFAYLGDNLHYYLDRIANESYLDTAVEPRSVVHLLRLIGYELRPPRPASADLTLTFEKPQDGQQLKIETGTVFEANPKVAGDKIQFRFVRKTREVRNEEVPIEDQAELDGNAANGTLRLEGLPVVQVDDSVDELVGSSDGTASQRFALSRGPLIDDSLEVHVDEGPGQITWQRVPSLLYSVRSDPHYVVRRDEQDVAWIELGDGKYGSIPHAGSEIRASYLVGGGEKGNVPAGAIDKAVSSIEALVSVSNPQAAAGGVEREPLDAAVARGPQIFRARGRAVTARDYEAWAREFGIGKVRARAPGWNRIELIVAPAGGGYPSDTLKEDLRTFLDDKRMVTSIIDVVDPVYVKVAVAAELEIDPFHDAEAVRQEADDAVRALLAFERVDFEHTLYLSKVYEAIEAVAGVAWVHITRLARRDEPGRALPEAGRLIFSGDELPLLGELELAPATEGRQR